MKLEITEKDKNLLNLLNSAGDLDKIRDLAQKRWNKIKNDANDSWCKEDALVYALEVYNEYKDVDIYPDEYADLLNSII